MSAIKRRRKLKCSFCGKSDQDVTRLIGGPGVHICDACVGICNKVLEATPVAFAGACAIASAPARAEIHLQVLATDPPSSSVLGRWEQLWLRIGYTTDQRIMLRAQPYFAGQRVPAPNGGSPTVGPGTGERSLW